MMNDCTFQYFSGKYFPFDTFRQRTNENGKCENDDALSKTRFVVVAMYGSDGVQYENCIVVKIIVART